MKTKLSTALTDALLDTVNISDLTLDQTNMYIAGVEIVVKDFVKKLEPELGNIAKMLKEGVIKNNG